MMENAPLLAARELAMREPPVPVIVGESRSYAVRTAAHDWPGKLFVWLSRLTAAGLGIYAFVTIPSGVLNLDTQLLATGLPAGVGYLLQRRLSEGVRHFTRWGWYGAMMEVGAVTAAKLWAIATGSVSGVGIMLVLDVVWLRYFWHRRAEFDVDLGG